jgi:hypothetical protein
MTDIKPGDRVRVTVEGELRTNGDDTLVLRSGDGMRWPFHRDYITGIEVIPQPESWQSGDVVLDAGGDVWKRTADGLAWWWWCGCRPRGAYDDATPIRPLRLLVRDGKPVT